MRRFAVFLRSIFFSPLTSSRPEVLSMNKSFGWFSSIFNSWSSIIYCFLRISPLLINVPSCTKLNAPVFLRSRRLSLFSNDGSWKFLFPRKLPWFDVCTSPNFFSLSKSFALLSPLTTYVLWFIISSLEDLRFMMFPFSSCNLPYSSQKTALGLSWSGSGIVTKDTGAC